MTPTPPQIELAEGGSPVVVALKPAQVATLAGVPELVRIGPTGAGLWRLSAQQRVGLVRLGRDDGAVELRIRPKLAVNRLMLLLAYADPDVWRDNTVTAGREAELEEAVAHAYAKAADRALLSGVLHGYIHHQDDLTVIRGRIRTHDQVGRRFGLALPVAVEYDDFTADIAENRLLLAAMERLRGLRTVHHATQTLLRHLAGRLVGVAPTRTIPRWRATRLNERYVPALRLAELILQGASVEQTGGPPVDIDGFVLDLATLFERFVTDSLANALGRFGLRCTAQESHHRLDQAGRIRFRPDIVAYRDGAPATVIDAKYKTSEGGVPSTADLFQLVAYCTALGLDYGHLIYAAGQPATTDHRIRLSGITISVHILDHGQPLAVIQETVASIAARIETRSCRWTGSSTTAARS